MLSVLHEQSYVPHIVQHNGDFESISHMPVCCTAFSKQQKKHYVSKITSIEYHGSVSS